MYNIYQPAARACACGWGFRAARHFIQQSFSGFSSCAGSGLDSFKCLVCKPRARARTDTVTDTPTHTHPHPHRTPTRTHPLSPTRHPLTLIPTSTPTRTPLPSYPHNKKKPHPAGFSTRYAQY